MALEAEKTNEILERLRAEEAQRLGREAGEKSYRAIDPSNRYVRCACGKPTCWTHDLLPLRAHTAALFRAILALGADNEFNDVPRHDEPWPGVIYALQMAGGVEDISTDPSYAFDDDSAFYCESAADREDEDRELASKYTAALVIFNFAWTAYEAAIEISSEGEYQRDKLPVRARKLFQAEATKASRIIGLEACYQFARRSCFNLELLRPEIELIETKYTLQGPPAAAELVRLFRNHIVHGRDELPVYSVDPCYRLYAVTRVVLLLIQYLVLRKVREPQREVYISATWEELGKEPADLMMCNLHYADRRWRTSSPVSKGFGPKVRPFHGS